MDDDYYMEMALEQAREAERIGEVPVGAVIIDTNLAVIGQGYNCPISRNDPTCHAEINAIRMAAERMANYRLPGATLYVTVEPCIMCMGAIVHARIRRVVYGAPDPKWGAVESLYRMADDRRLNHTPDIRAGVRHTRAREMMTHFFKKLRS